MLIKDTTAVMLVRGLAILLLGGALVSNAFNLPVLGWLIKSSIPALLVAVPILFQPELRRVLEQLGRFLPTHLPTETPLQVVEVVAVASRRLAERRWGALIVIERATLLGEYAAKGVEVDAILSVDMLEQIFHPSTRLHDGAAIVRGDRILAAGCLLPLTESLGGGQSLGTRHRAAVGISEQTDALVVVISEETGQISIANNGRLVRNFDEAKLRKVLSILFRPTHAEDFTRRLRHGRSAQNDGPASAQPTAAGSGRPGGLLAPLGALLLLLERFVELFFRGPGGRS
jgi:diadenylate cyclase